MKRLLESLAGKNQNHIFPFLWLHGEDEHTLREYMGKIQESGIQAVCLEARPHPEFVRDGWWRDLDVILDEAKKRDMKLWILDDSHFPTGFANGAIKERYPQYRKRFLKLYQLDFAGPVKYAQAMIRYAFSDSEDVLIGVYLAKKLDFERIDVSTIRNISDGVRGRDSVSFELPEGEWKVLVLVSSFKGGEKETEGYLNPIVPEATDVLISEVYEPHYEHYKDEFGKTILGFFSDEPRFGNVHGPYGSIGRTSMVLPWREDLPELLRKKISLAGTDNAALESTDIRSLLPLLFIEGENGAGEETAWQIRYHYMDLVSSLYSEHFSERIGAWCHAHGVSYIGHTIEDNNAHARLGYGAGHFFRAMKGQDMAGIDVVLHQLMPGMDHTYNKAMTGKGWDGEFFHYVLGKLGASLGHIDPVKKGRVMCEVFGAYGWAEGNRLMKWIADYMLVRGVNEFVPHAFDPKEYPDADCPPHFYAHGKNPQYQDFRLLMQYMNRLAHLLSGGVHRAPVAVSYHGEAEWSGDYMLMQKPCAKLCRNQIDYDILPQEEIIKGTVKEGCLAVQQESFEALVIPYAEALPAKYVRRLVQFADAGLSVYILEGLPERSSEGVDISAELEKLSQHQNISEVGIEELVKALRSAGIGEVQCSSYEPYLRYYHYDQPDGEVIMFVNEAPYQSIHTDVKVPLQGICYRYDALENKLTELEINNEIHLNLAPGESAVYCRADLEVMMEDSVRKSKGSIIQREPESDDRSYELKTTVVSGPFRISFAKEEEYPVFSETTELPELVPMQQVKGKEDFCGTIRYECTFEIADLEDQTELILDTVYEGARVSVNGSEMMRKICAPYRFDITNLICKGKNSLVIEVTTTLAREQKDWLSQFVLLEPTGITDRILIRQYKKVEAK